MMTHFLFRCFLLSIYQSSVNGNIPKIPYPWLVFNEKVKVNSVFLRDSTGISDSVLLLFGGNISRGGLVRLLILDMIVTFLCFLHEKIVNTPPCFW